MLPVSVISAHSGVFVLVFVLQLLPLLLCTSIGGGGGGGVLLIWSLLFVLLFQCGIIDSEHEGFVSVRASRVLAKGTR